MPMCAGGWPGLGLPDRLDQGEHVDASVDGGCVEPGAAVGAVRDAVPEDQDVVARRAEHGVRPGSGVDDVVAAVTADLLAAGAAGEPVGELVTATAAPTITAAAPRRPDRYRPMTPPRLSRLGPARPLLGRT